MIYGLDFLGLPKYSKVALKEFPNSFALGCFSSTFGDARPAVEAILKTGKPRLVRVQLCWKDDHNFSKQDFPEIKKEAEKWAPLVNKYPQFQWLFSGACEHRLNKEDALKLANVVCSVFPEKVLYVNCPMKGGADLKGYINERHGNKARVVQKDDAFSFDGSPCVDSDVEKLKKEFFSAPYFMLWEPRFNGRWEDDDTTPRPLRKGWPDGNLIKSVVALSGKCGEVDLPKGWLYKSHAENNGDGDKRAEKPLIISPIRTKMITLEGESRKPLATLRYYGTFNGGGYRYYATQWGYEIADRPVNVCIGSRVYGRINPVFRHGSFR